MGRDQTRGGEIVKVTNKSEPVEKLIYRRGIAAVKLRKWERVTCLVIGYPCDDTAHSVSITPKGARRIAAALIRFAEREVTTHA
jgi:hypothetical protein